MADVVGTLSVVADLGFGLPPRNALRSSLIAVALGRRIGLEDDELRGPYYACLLAHIGCISMSHETAALFGDELEITRAVAMTNLGDPQDIVETLIPQITRGLSAEAGERKAEAVMTHAPTFGLEYDTASTEVARRTARRMGLPENVQRCLFQQAEEWRGGGAPDGLKGQDIDIGARITRLAGDAAFFNHLGGVDLAKQAVSARAGTLHDPQLADAFCADAEEILAAASEQEPEPLLLAAEPRPMMLLDSRDLVDISAAFGDAADLKTPFTHGHSGATAEVAHAAAERMGLEAVAAEEVRLAAYLHDVGRVAISNAIWEKPGRLSSGDWEEVRMHAYHAERIVVRSPLLKRLERLIGMHHERSDGSGYHRGSRAAEIPVGARIIAVADAWVSMQQARPHREPFDPDRAASELKAAAEAGRFDPRAVAAVIDGARGAGSTRAPLPAGLSERELDVLRLVAEGASNPEIAERLFIARRTAEHHVQHIYRKIGVSTRPGAAMFALEHGLLETPVSA